MSFIAFHYDKSVICRISRDGCGVARLLQHALACGVLGRVCLVPGETMFKGARMGTLVTKQSGRRVGVMPDVK